MSTKPKSETQDTTQKNTSETEFELSTGTKVVMQKPSAAQIIKARRVAPDSESVEIFLIAEVATFDGVKVPAPELIDKLDGDDYLVLEMCVKKFISPKRSSLPAMLLSLDT